MRLAICDDSRPDADAIAALCAESSVGGLLESRVFYSGEQLRAAYESGERYDIVLLDVRMPDADGIQLGKHIKELDPDAVLIFISSYPQYAVESYDCPAFYYIVKPCSPEKLDTTLCRAVEHINSHRQTITVYRRNVPISLRLCDVYYIEYFKKHIIFHMAEERVEVVGSLAEAYAKCRRFGFHQVHQGYVVNMNKIRSIGDKFVILENGVKVEISVRKRAETLLAYANFLEKLP